MTINFKSTPIAFGAKGTGNPIVLLHGFLESSKIWEPFIADLSKKRKVIYMDLPGHGGSGTLGEVHTMEQQATIVKTVLDTLGETSVTLVGHSMGGYVCLAFLEQYPELVKSIMLMNSTPEADDDEKQKNRDRAIDLVKRNKKTYISMAISNLLTPENNEKFKTQIDDLKEEALTFPEEGIINSLKGMKIRTERIDVLRKFYGSKYFMIGKKDPVTDWEQVNNIAEACDCKIFLTENGHLSYLEDSAEVREILHFID